MKAKVPGTRKHLFISGLLERTRRCFERIEDPITRSSVTLADCLMSALAIFGLKYPSLLQFDKDTRQEETMLGHNLRTLYGIQRVPSDTYLRERLDEIVPIDLQKAIDRIIAQLQRGKVLERYRHFEEYCLVSIDASGYFSSHEVHCTQCCEKHHKDGTVTYYHQMLAAVMVHPSYPTVFPLAVEPIQKQDGQSKNDCEHNAAKRLLNNLRARHPHLKMIVVLDGLYADGMIINLLKALDFRFIITAKEKGLKYLFEFYQASKPEKVILKNAKQECHYHFVNKLPLNDTHSNLEVNVLECLEISKHKKTRFCWLTDLPLTEKTVVSIAKGGRARWRIENETFNTLKNQGYQFEHNFGHGNKNLSTVFAYLMFIAFLIDQVQQFCCQYFKAALAAAGRRLYLWNKIRGLFLHYLVDSWEDLYTAVIKKPKGVRLRGLLDTS